MKTKTTTEKLKQSIISNYRKRGNDKALLFKNGRVYTGNELAQEIEQETEIGIDILNSLIKLTIELLSRDKINLEK